MTTAKKREQIVLSLQEKEARDAYVRAHIETGIPFQIRSNRKQRDWSQKELGQRTGMKQPALSRLEAGESGLPNLDTLLRLASAFDVALIVRFVPFSDLLDWTQGLGYRELSVPSFASDTRLFSRSSSEIFPLRERKSETPQELLRSEATQFQYQVGSQIRSGVR